MARKPHNYAHFQNLVNELKDQNAGNIASLQSHLEIQTDGLQSMKGFMLKELQTDADRLRKEKENRLEGRDSKGKKKEWVLPKGMRAGGGKGFMGMLGNFLSTALLGIPGGLRKFLPRTLGLPLLGVLARGIATLVAGPALIEALKAGFDQDTFSGGVTAFIDSYFAPRGKPYQSLAQAAFGGAGKGALIGMGLLGVRGAIIGGVLGGALSGLNHVFNEDKSKMDSGAVVKKMKTYLLDNLEAVFGIGVGIMGGKAGLAIFGFPGMIAGAILGAGIGYIGTGALKEMIKVEQGGEKDLGVAFKEGLKNWYMKMDWGTGIWPAGLGAAFGVSVFSKFGPHAMLAGGIFGAAAGLLGGPILSEALRIDKKEGKGMAEAMKKATWNYIVRTSKNRYVTSALAGATAGGILGGVGSLPGIIAGTIIGAVFGVIVQWLTDTIGNFAADQFKKVFGVEEIVSEEQRKYNEAVEKNAQKGSFTRKLLTAKSKRHFSGRALPGVKQGVDDPFTVMQRLKEEYLKHLVRGEGWSGTFDPVAAQKAAIAVKSVGERKGDWKRIEEEAMAIKLMQLKDRATAAEEWGGGEGGSIMQDQSVQNVNVNYFTEGQMDYLDMNGKGLIENVR